jgi:hypothetical protein
MLLVLSFRSLNNLSYARFFVPFLPQLNIVSAYKVLDFAGFGLSTDQWMREYKANQEKILEHYTHGEWYKVAAPLK